MSGKYDQATIDAGYVEKEDVSKRYKIRLCRDRTLSVTKDDEKPFNGVAIAVLSTDSLKDAESLIMFVGKQQYTEHPQIPGKPWFRFLPDMEYEVLEYDDLPRMVEKLKVCLNIIQSRKKKRAA